MELPEPYHRLGFDRWRKMMKAFPRSYATAGARHWLQTRGKVRLRCEMQNTELFARSEPLTPEEIKALQEDKRKSIERLEAYHRALDQREGASSQTSPIA